MSSVKVNICKSPKEKFWEIPIVDGNLLISWDGPASIDESVPDIIQDILTKALSEKYEVSWLSDTILDGSKEVRLKYDFLESIGYLNKKLKLVTSHDVDVIKLAFKNAYFNWHQHSQMFLLSYSAPSLIPAKPVLGAIGTTKPEILKRLWEFNFQAVLLPGVDGCYAGFYSKDKHDTDVFLQALQKHTESLSGIFALHEEEQFREI